jgi:hypothetical protein
MQLSHHQLASPMDQVRIQYPQVHLQSPKSDKISNNKGDQKMLLNYAGTRNKGRKRPQNNARLHFG